MRRRRHESGAAVLQCEAQRVLDRAAGHLVVTRKPSKHRKPRSVGGSPRQRPLLVAKQVPNSRGVRVPATVTLRVRTIQLIQPATAVIKYQHVPIAAPRIRIPLDRRAGRHWHRPRIALVSVSCEIDHYRWLRRVHHDVGNSDARAVILARAKIRMHRIASSDEIYNGRGVRIHRRARDVLIPQIVRREGQEAVQAAALANTHHAARARWWRRIPSGLRSHRNIDRAGIAAAWIWIADADGKYSGGWRRSRRRELRS